MLKILPNKNFFDKLPIKWFSFGLQYPLENSTVSNWATEGAIVNYSTLKGLDFVAQKGFTSTMNSNI